MIRGYRAQFRRQFRAPATCQLVGVHSDAQAMLPGRTQNPAGSLDSEVASLAKNIAKLRQLLFSDPRNHLIGDQVDIAIWRGLKILWDRVGSQECRHKLD